MEWMPTNHTRTHIYVYLYVYIYRYVRGYIHVSGLHWRYSCVLTRDLASDGDDEGDLDFSYQQDTIPTSNLREHERYLPSQEEVEEEKRLEKQRRSKPSPPHDEIIERKCKSAIFSF